MRIGVDCPFLLDTQAFGLHEFESDDARKDNVLTDVWPEELVQEAARRIRAAKRA